VIKWGASKFEIQLMAKIVDRAIQDLDLNPEKRGVFMMDLEACHVSGNPLDLNALLYANRSDFAHDVLGIHHHINRKTGVLKDLFVPRMSLRERA